MSIQAGTLQPKYYSQVRRKGGGTVDQIDAPVVASITIQKGDWLKLGAGKVTPALTKSGTPGAAVLTTAAPGLYAIALGGITTDSNGIATDGTGRTTLPIALLNDDTEIMVGIHNASGASATQANVVVGTTYDLAVVTSTPVGGWTWAMSTTIDAGACLTLIEKSVESSPTEQYGFVWVKPIAAARVGA